MPVEAVSAGGTLCVSSGSTMATVGSIPGLRMLALMRCSGEPRTALRVTSAPVPAVVGRAMWGAARRGGGWPFPTTSRYSSTSPRLAISAAQALPRSIALPPPKLTTKSQRESRASRAAARAICVVGSPETRNSTIWISAARSDCTSGAARSGDWPVTTNARRPRSAASEAALAEAPGPNRIRPAVANSKRMASPSFRGAHPHPVSSGNTFAYFTLQRGSAIISSTASRQAL
ncbi:MAG: hypothetical protein BWZ10_01870 [candidate division BRC1 bacterium ADurb.BinA364]|nr:MAG: hypothetical protein BWZ10_01870 [candidate division BRC1 bacterium ADurb.BinA364]